MPNMLADETSPYLLQHKDNPVEWHAWSKATLERAMDEDRPIFLSIGYSSCHWCHVMERESFENRDIAEIMNENFVCIKVDREEHPDVDHIYQKACQLATGTGGWPLSAFLTPDQRPFYVGTYFPPLDGYGRPGFGSILRRMAQAWSENRDDVKGTAANFAKNLDESTRSPKTSIGRAALDEAAVNLLGMADDANGGFGRAPKFPNAACVSFLFSYWKMSGISKFRQFALKTLDRMQRGGIFDHVGGGFHRYSTDERWLVPHFEKMLYDNALLPANYADAYQITADQKYLDTMCKILDYLIRDMRTAEGGFCSAEDADSQGEEGKYYCWTKKDVQDTLGDDAEMFCVYYNIAEGGNWEGTNIIHNTMAASTAAFHLGVDEDALRRGLSRGMKKLFEARADRARPGRDDKVVLSWNAMAASALIRGYRLTGNAKYMEAARGCVHLILDRMRKGDRLLHTRKGGISKIDGYLEDYACLADALLDMFEVEADAARLETAASLADHMIGHFWDAENGGFFMTADYSDNTVYRPKNTYDLSTPSGNSVAARVLLRLYRMTGDAKYHVYKTILENHMQQAAENPFAFGNMLCVAYSHMEGREIIILDDSAHAIKKATMQYLPADAIIGIQDSAMLERLSHLELFAGKNFEEVPVAYVCKNHACSAPMRGEISL